MTAMKNKTATTPCAATTDSPATSAVRITDLSVAYDETPVLWDIDIDVPTETIMGVVGPNGAGKSTLIKAIMGIVEPAGCEVRVFGRPFRDQRRRVGYVL